MEGTSLATEETEAEKIERESNNQEELDHAAELVKEAQGQVEKEQSINIRVPVDQLLAADRASRKLFFAHLVKQIKGKLEIIRIERSLQQ